MRRPVLIGVFIIMLLIFSACAHQTTAKRLPENKPVAAPAKQVNQEKVSVVETFNPIFEVQALDKTIEQRISGVSWREGSPVNMDELSYVKVAYWGFDDKGHIGELIVNKAVAKEVADIFQELYDNRFPIEKIKLIDEYAADDTKSMEDNNTSSFNYREVEGKPGTVSKHAYGLAVDINPVQNPYIYKDKISPESGKVFTDRTDIRKGMIVKGDICYKAFTERGWQWGGDWKYEKDYQHFQKNIR